MKKRVLSVIIVVLLFSLIIVQKPRRVSAEGSWVLPEASAATTFSSVNLDEVVETAPSWLHLFSDGIKTTAPAKICYSFQRGEFKWVPKIYQYKNNKWTAVKTTKEYIHGEEGGLFACAQATGAGTFALFAYYNGPAESQTETETSVSCAELAKNWHVDLVLMSTEVFNFVGHFDNISQAGIAATYSTNFNDGYGSGSFALASLSGSGVTEIDGGGSKVVFSNVIPNDPWSLKITLSAQGCSVTRPITITGN